MAHQHPLPVAVHDNIAKYWVQSLRQLIHRTTLSPSTSRRSREALESMLAFTTPSRNDFKRVEYHVATSDVSLCAMAAEYAVSASIS